MKILHVINDLETGGAQRLISDFLPEIKQKGVDVSLLVFRHIDNHFSQRIESAGIPVIVLNAPRILSPGKFLCLRNLFSQFDLVHVHLFPALYWCALASIGITTKMVWTEHSTSNRRRNCWYYQPIEQFMYGRYDRLVSISQQTQESLQQWNRRADERYMVVENGVDINRFSQTVKPVIGKSLIMVSRFVASKDQATVIRAMQYLDNDITLRFVGAGPNLPTCQQLAEELDVAQRVQFLGERTDIDQLIAESYIGIQSSHWEGFGLTAVEIMASGKPVVACNVEGLRQVVEGAGLLFEKGDEKALAGCIKQLIDDPSAYEACQKRCKERAQSYSIENMARKYLKIYETLLHE